MAQTILDIFDPNDDDLEQRLRDHITKAMREAKVVTNWSHPDPEPEEQVGDLVGAAVVALQSDPPAALERLIAQGQRLSLIQTALKIVMPGVPDIYRGVEGAHLALTDPDNRLPVGLQVLRALPAHDGFSGQKSRLTRRLLALRRERPDFFDGADARLSKGTDGVVCLTRTLGDLRLCLRFHPVRDLEPPHDMDARRDGSAVTVTFI